MQGRVEFVLTCSGSNKSQAAEREHLDLWMEVSGSITYQICQPPLGFLILPSLPVNGSFCLFFLELWINACIELLENLG